MTDESSSARITLCKHPDCERIAILRMQDEEAKNTFTDEFIEAFQDALERVSRDRQVHVCILQGLSDVFCAGASKQALTELSDGDFQVKDLVLSELLLQVPIPTVAAMEGAALGGGFVVALCCDIIIMNERRMYGTNFTDMGFTPGMGCTRLIQAAVGDYIANEMMYTGRLFKGRAYKGRSLINHILPHAEIMPKAVDIAMDIESKPRATLETLKYSLSMQKRQALIEARVHEDFMHRLTFSRPDVQEMIRRRYNG